tara:strand:+ start:582 stop:950 length:369 start_codon:yes stop_codon:yes gene_type:complete
MYKYFSIDELKCQHCEKQGMNKEFMLKVEALRHELGFPFTVTSAYRCKDHPIEARKASPGSHESGRALDIGLRGEQAYKLIQAALTAGFTGIGVNQKGSSRFIHLDDLENSKGRPRPHIWSY